uniref:Putative ovule protein n=1 Tax=Solanum chacoense TaxID=4108 RepID=A0A0V0GNE9_SOLCH
MNCLFDPNTAQAFKFYFHCSWWWLAPNISYQPNTHWNTSSYSYKITNREVVALHRLTIFTYTIQTK